MRTQTIVGHRGAAGIELENTLSSFKKAIEVGANAIEFDVHITKDGYAVVCHDPDLERVSGSKEFINSLTYEEVQKIALHNGERIPKLRDVLEAAAEKNVPVIVEIKVNTHIEEILQILSKFPKMDITIASFDHDVVKQCKQLRPDIPGFVAEEDHPFTAIKTAKAIHADGIDLNYKRLTPIVYWRAKRAGLQLMVYTVNNPLIVRQMHLLYPDVWICTNYPNRYVRSQHTKQRHSNQSHKLKVLSIDKKPLRDKIGL
ncbi:MAG TPA: glycerophosphodiester phosphodiesterase family protein [Candidatus Saccharimonadales bacterium]|nr:glycerophosphodiester phosphodiesterase family protein [Candidatus Saccharimonadales bacterium]